MSNKAKQSSEQRKWHSETRKRKWKQSEVQAKANKLEKSTSKIEFFARLLKFILWRWKLFCPFLSTSPQINSSDLGFHLSTYFRIVHEILYFDFLHAPNALCWTAEARLNSNGIRSVYLFIRRDTRCMKMVASSKLKTHDSITNSWTRRDAGIDPWQRAKETIIEVWRTTHSQSVSLSLLP